MNGWYPMFMLAVAALWLFASPRDRPAASIVLLATLGSWLITEGVTRHIDGSWKLVIPGAVETATIIALLLLAGNRTGHAQAALLFVAWWAHLLCYLDIQLGTNVVYDRYEAVLGLVAAGQIIAFHDTVSHLLRQLGHWCHSLWGRSVGAFRHSSVPSAFLHRPRNPSV